MLTRRGVSKYASRQQTLQWLTFLAKRLQQYNQTVFYLEHLQPDWLWCTGSLPWNLIAFLDEAADRLLLRKVGGGYIFVHRLLLEYFASLDTTATPNAVRAKKEQG